MTFPGVLQAGCKTAMRKKVNSIKLKLRKLCSTSQLFPPSLTSCAVNMTYASHTEMREKLTICDVTLVA